MVVGYALVFLFAVWYVDRLPFVRRLWSRFIAKTDGYRPLAYLRPERRLAIAGVGVALASIAALAVISGTADRRAPFFMAAASPFFITGGLGGMIAAYAGALSLLRKLGLRENPGNLN